MIGKEIISALEQEKRYIERIILSAEKELSKAPDGRIQVKKYKKGAQYFFRSDSPKSSVRYLPADNRELASALMQKDYNKRIIAAAREQKKSLDSFLNRFDPKALAGVYEAESKLRQVHLKPYELPDDVFAEVWQAEEYERKPFREDAPEHYTEKKERVRSKSEVMIANALFRAGIPYRYECPLKLGNQIIHPDFSILRMRDRCVVYWEHLGMMDDAEYRNNAFQRIRLLEANGIFPGDQLILTSETYRMPLNAYVVERMINHYLL